VTDISPRIHQPQPTRNRLNPLLRWRRKSCLHRSPLSRKSDVSTESVVPLLPPPDPDGQVWSQQGASISGGTQEGQTRQSPAPQAQPPGSAPAKPVAQQKPPAENKIPPIVIRDASKWPSRRRSHAWMVSG
jgi:hypothetical protein